MKKWMLLLFVSALLLASCGGGQTPEAAPTEVASVVAQAVEGKVIAEATIEPARWSELRFQVGGTVEEVLVDPGDVVGTGDVLVRLDATDAELAVQEAESAVAEAEAQLALLKAGPRAQEVAAAEQDLEAAKAALSRAVAQRDQLTGGAIEADVAAAQAEVTAADAERLRVREEHRRVHEQSNDEAAREDADYRLYAAREALAAAQTKLEVQRNVVEYRVREVQAGVWAASAQRDVAQAELDQVKAGSASWEIASAEAGLQQAEAALDAAKVALERTVLRAPFGGTVTRVDTEVGNTVAPGQVVVVLVVLDDLQARTIDLTELDVVRVVPDQAATVTVDALPDTPLRGHVTRIGLRDVDYRGDVTYPVIVELDETVPEIRWGMTALVEIETD